MKEGVNELTYKTEADSQTWKHTYGDQRESGG